MRRWLLWGGLVFTGCAVGPNFQPPQAPVPASWMGEQNTASAAVEWWQTFHDPKLDSLIERAARSNLDVRVAEERLLEARALRRGAAWELLPTITGNASYLDQQRAETAQTFSAPNQIFHTQLYDAHFDARWEIDTFGGRRRALQSASALYRAVEEERRLVLVSVLAEVARNYVEVRGYQERLHISRQNIATQSNIVELIQARFLSGLANELDVRRAQALLASTRAQVPPSLTAAEQAVNRLGVLLGQLPGPLHDELERGVTPVPPPPPSVPVGLPSELLRRRPDVRSAEHQLAAATADIGVETAELFPKFSLIGIGGFQSLAATDWFVPQGRYWSAGPTVTWRLLDFGRIRARINAANARQRQTLARYEKAVLTAFADVENALVACANEQVRHRALQESVAAHRQSLALANDLYARGLRDFLNVLDAQRALLQAEDQLVVSNWTLSQNVVALYKALGGGWEKTYADHPE